MALIPLYEAKTYLRVDSSDEDALIGILLSSAEQMCKDVGRLSEDQWEAVNAADRDAENGVQPTRELEALRSTCRVAGRPHIAPAEQAGIEQLQSLIGKALK